MLINKKSENELSGFYIIFNGSVLNENSSNYGISHLCEHLKCRMFNKLYNIFDRYNITWNATTSDDYVMFFIHGLGQSPTPTGVGLL